MLEYYWAYADFEDAMDLTEDMLRKLTQDGDGHTQWSTRAAATTFPAFSA